MREIRYADAGMDMKKLILCFTRRLWVVLLAAVIGGALGGALYTVANIVPESERQYQAMAKIYLDFAADETGEVYQAYNGYTWNDLMATEPVLNKTMQHLPEDYSREEVIEATKAEILSDLRLLTITVTTHDRERCDTILKATKQSLTERGSEAKEFRSITAIRTTEAELLTADDRMLRAVLLGLVTAVCLILAAMLLFYVLDDRIMVAADFRQVTDAVFVGYAGIGGRLEQDYEANLAYLRRQRGYITLLCLQQDEALTEEKWRGLYAADGVIVAVPYGKLHAVYLDYMIEQLKIRECPLVGVAIEGADEKFLLRYYGGIV